MHSFIHLYRPLIRNLVLIIGVIIMLSAGTLLYFDQRLVHALSEGLIEKSTHATEQRLDRLFNGSSRALRSPSCRFEDPAHRRRLRGGMRLFGALEPFLANVEHLDSINLADMSGNEFVLIKQKDEILIAPGGRGTGNRPLAAQTAQPGHRGTGHADRLRAIGPAVVPGAARIGPRQAFWTPPYAFATTKEPGISVASQAGGARQRRPVFHCVQYHSHQYLPLHHPPPAQREWHGRYFRTAMA